MWHTSYIFSSEIIVIWIQVKYSSIRSWLESNQIILIKRSYYFVASKIFEIISIFGQFAINMIYFKIFFCNIFSISFFKCSFFPEQFDKLTVFKLGGFCIFRCASISRTYSGRWVIVSNSGQ